MKIYNYDKNTFELIGEEVAELDPIATKRNKKDAKEGGEYEEIYLLPAYATTIKPLNKKDGFAICFNKKSQIWEYKKDLRGKEFWSKTDGSSVIVDKLDFDIKDYITTAPKENQIMQNGKWVDDITKLKKEMITLIHQKKDELNYSNYEFENHIYRMGADVQADLLATITIFGAVGSLPAGYTIKDIKTNEYVAFDLPKLVKLSAEVATRKATAIFKTQKLEDAINKCTTKAELDKIELKLV